MNDIKRVQYMRTEEEMVSFIPSVYKHHLVFSKFLNHPYNHLYTIHEISSILIIYSYFLDEVIFFKEAGRQRSGLRVLNAKFNVFGNFSPDSSYEEKIMSEKAYAVHQMLMAYKCFKAINILNDDYIYRYRLMADNPLHEIEIKSRNLEYTLAPASYLLPFHDYVKIIEEEPENLLSQNYKTINDYYYNNLCEQDFARSSEGYQLYLASTQDGSKKLK